MKIYPVTTNFDKRQIGELRLMDNVLPKGGEYYFEVGGVEEKGKFVLKEVSLVTTPRHKSHRMLSGMQWPAPVPDIFSKDNMLMAACILFIPGAMLLAVAQSTNNDIYGWIALLLCLPAILGAITSPIVDIDKLNRDRMDILAGRAKGFFYEET